MNIPLWKSEPYPAPRHSRYGDPILRAGRPLESCKFVGDDDDETLHFGAYDEG